MQADCKTGFPTMCSRRQWQPLQCCADWGGGDNTSQRDCWLTYEEGVCFGDGHDAHDGGDAAPKGNEALQGVASNVPEGAGGPAMQCGGLPPGEAGQVQPVHILQEIALQKLQQTREGVAPASCKSFFTSSRHMPCRNCRKQQREWRLLVVFNFSIPGNCLARCSE